MIELETTLLIGLILICFSFLQYVSNKKTFPYTIAILSFGLIAKELFSFFHLHADLSLSSEMTYYVFLPILLFGSAMHLNFHQFRLQFKTISFLSTFGLLTSVAIIGVLLSMAVGWDLQTGLMFGALISATDPIAVLALFQSLGGPRRLALIADGESMLNDATAVVLFRILMAMVVGGHAFSSDLLVHSAGEFAYVFFGSILAGAIYGYIVSMILAKIENDLAVETTLTIGAALVVFTASEHFLHLSGVISAVIAGLFVGNLGRSRISPKVIHFVHEMWDYLGFVAVSLVFFFATYNLEVASLLESFPGFVWAILIMLVARAISIYLSIFITNHAPFFKDEPNIPMSWQHVLNWGGLRGVIPLVLIFSLPDGYEYKKVMFDFTFAILLFTLFVNGSTMAWLLKKLKLHLPSEAEKIKKLYDDFFDLEAALRRIKLGKIIGLDKSIIRKQTEKWSQDEEDTLQQVCNFDAAKYLDSIRMQALIIERSVYEKMLERQEISEAVFYELDAQLDLQADAIEYPQLSIRTVDQRGRVNDKKLFRQRTLGLVYLLRKKSPIALFRLDENRLLLHRYMIMRARATGSTRVLEYLTALQDKMHKSDLKKIISNLMSEYDLYLKKSNSNIAEIKKQIDLTEYSQEILSHALVHHHSPWLM
jgi:CPA1 family monovalent cation:H+ antiporter